MTDEMKNNEEQVTDVSSLIALCQRTDNMPVIQKLALKQKVAFHFEYTLHSYMRNEGHPTNKFATYISLLETKPEYYGNVCDILTENFVSEEVVEECLMYIRSGIIPYHLWTDKLVHDLKESFYYNQASIGGLLTVYLGKTLKASLIAFNKVVKVLEEEFCQEFSYDDNPNAGRLGIKKEDDKWQDVKDGIAFVKARALEYPQDLKEKYMKAFSTNDDSERVKFLENETTIFTETLIDMLKYPFDQEVIDRMQAGAASPFEDFWVTPPFGGGSTLVSYARGAGNTMQQAVGEQQEQQGGMGSWLTMLGFGPNGEPPEEMARREELARRQDELMLDENEEADTTSVYNFHWDNPQFRALLRKYDLEGTDVEADMYNKEVRIDRDYIEFEYVDLVNENFDEGDPEWISDEEVDEIVREFNRFKPHAERAYARFVERHRQEEETQRIARSKERFEREQATRNISNEKNIQYCVKKVARDGSERVMSENWFETEKQAQEFVKEVTESNPAMAKAFEFKIETGVRQ